MSEIEVIQTERFGELQIPKEEILLFAEGLLGFADKKYFVLVQEATYAPFLWLQSTEDPHLAFVVVDPLIFLPQYQVEIKQSDIQALELESMEKARVLVIVVVKEDPSQITANLQGPLVLNPSRGLGRQVVMLTDRYHTRHRILEEVEKVEAQEKKADPKEKGQEA